MVEGSSTKSLFNSVAKRMQINCILRRLQIFVIIFSAIYALLLMTSRLTGLIPDLFSITTVLIPLFGGLLTALLIPFKVNSKTSARQIDTFCKSNDLFLTVSTIGSVNGKFKDLVHEQAEKKAASLKADAIVSFNWQPVLRNFATAIIALIIGIYALPQLDPFGREEERARVEQKNKSLEEARKETEKRLVQLKKESEKPKDTVAAKLELTDIFKKMKMNTPEANREKLREERRKMARMWSDKNKQLNEEKKKLKFSSQSFGFNSDELKKIAKDLKQGDSSSAAKKLSELKNKLEDLAKGELSEEKKNEIADIKKEMEDLRDAMNEGMESESVKAAINRALTQMEELSEETKQALADAAKSLKLTERELQRLQQMMDEMEELQQMMQTAQQADQLAQQMQNSQQGQSPPEYESFQEYQEYFNQQNQGGDQQQQQAKCETCQGSGKCKKCNGSGEDVEDHVCLDCQGSGKCPDCGGKGSKSGGQSNGGQGSGNSSQQQIAQGGGNGGTSGGGNPGEVNDETSTVKENAKSKTQPGKILMEWKTKGLSEKGEVNEEYQAAMQEIKEGVDEAISKENIPPGYHDIIKKYFSSEGRSESAEKK